MKSLMAIYVLGLTVVVGVILWRTTPAPPAPPGAVAARSLPANHLIGPGDVRAEAIVGYTTKAVEAGQPLSGGVLSRTPALQAKPTEVLTLLAADPATVRRNAGAATKICQGSTLLALVEVQAVICDTSGACRAAVALPAATAAKLGTDYVLKPASANCTPGPAPAPNTTVSTS